MMQRNGILARENMVKFLNVVDMQNFPASWGIEQLLEKLAKTCRAGQALVIADNAAQSCYISTFAMPNGEVPLDLTVLEGLLPDSMLLEIERSNDPRAFKALNLPSDQTPISYIAGLALLDSKGQRIGFICVLDSKPKRMNNLQKLAFEQLANSLQLKIEARSKLSPNIIDEEFVVRDLLREKVASNPSNSLESVFTEALDAIRDHISIIDESGFNIFVNKAWVDFSEKNSGIAQREQLGLGSNYLQVCERSAAQGCDDAMFVFAAINAALSSADFSVRRLEYPCHSADEERWFVASISALSINSRKLVVISHHIVTRRKQAEIENRRLVDKLEIRVSERTQELEKTNQILRNSEEKYRSIFRNSTVGFFITSLDGVCVDVNAAFCDLTGRKPKELIGQRISDVLFDHDANLIGHMQSSVLSGETVNQVRDVSIRRPDKAHSWARASVAAIFDGEGKPVQVMNLFQDFTLQKKAKQERDQVFEKSFDLFAIIEYDGTIFQANPACSRMFGIPGRSLPGKNMLEFIHPDDMHKASAVLKAMQEEDNEVPALDIRMHCKGGGYRDIRWSGSRHIEHARLIVVGRDVTSSLNSKRALQRLASRLQQIREEERTRISREIHDELGQILTALKIDLNLLNRDVGKSPNDLLKEDIASIIELVNSTLNSVKRIAQDLRPEVLDALGLVPALEWQAKETQSRMGLKCKIVCKQQIPELDSEQTTQLFRIIQESLTNVVRHADASLVKVVIELLSDNILSICIRDNGKGFNVQDVGFQSLGLLGMQERARNIGAHLEIKSKIDKGTTVKLRLPVDGVYWDEQE